MKSEQTLLRTWFLPPLRVEATGNSLVADFGVVSSELSQPTLRIPPTVERNSLEWLRADYVAKQSSNLNHEVRLGYAYFSADLSAAEEPVFDPTSEVCKRQINPRIYSGYYRQFL